MPEVYTWKEGPHPKIAAQIVGEELERVRQSHNGRMTTTDVVEAARPKTAPLHSAFEWNDAKAAEKWRQEQAGQMIRHISIQISRGGDTEPMTLRAFVSVRQDSAEQYTSMIAAMSDPELRVQIVARAWDELQSWRKRHNELAEFADIFASMDRLRLKGKAA